MKEPEFVRLTQSRQVVGVKNGKEKAKENELQVEKNISAGEAPPALPREEVLEEKSWFPEAWGDQIKLHQLKQHPYVLYI